jgi:hypothetical protein
MKKLLTITAVLLAGILGTAQADVSVSGSAEPYCKISRQQNRYY